LLETEQADASALLGWLENFLSDSR